MIDWFKILRLVKLAKLYISGVLIELLNNSSNSLKRIMATSFFFERLFWKVVIHSLLWLLWLLLFFIYFYLLWLLLFYKRLDGWVCILEKGRKNIYSNVVIRRSTCLFASRSFPTNSCISCKEQENWISRIVSVSLTLKVTRNRGAFTLPSVKDLTP